MRLYSGAWILWARLSKNLLLLALRLLARREERVKRKNPPQHGGFFLLTKTFFFYCPFTSEVALPESETPDGALHALAAVLNADQAEFRLVTQVF